MVLLTRLTFEKRDRLLRRTEFLHLKKYGKTIKGRLLIGTVTINDKGLNRLGITITRKVTNAVQRNRIKRITREFFRLNRKHLQKSWDVNIIAKRDAADAKNDKIREDLNLILKKLRSLESDSDKKAGWKQKKDGKMNRMAGKTGSSRPKKYNKLENLDCSKDKKLFHQPCSQWVETGLLLLIRMYQFLISPVLTSSCRFYPTCSVYARQSIERHGVLKGCYLTLKRVARCHPYSGGGYDPVP